MENGLVKLYFNKFLMLLLLLIVPFVNILLVNFSIYYFSAEKRTDFLVHIIYSNTINIFLVGLIAILLGVFISFKVTRTKAYSSIIIIILFISPFLESINYNLLMGYQIDTYGITDILNIFMPNGDWGEDNLYGIALEPYRWNKMFFWILIITILIINKIVVKKNLKSKCLILSISILALFNLIQSFNIGGSLIKDHRPKGFIAMDQSYYAKKPGENKLADFKVSSYDIDFKINRDLSAKVTLAVSGNSDNKLEFTLYRGYEVKKVYKEDLEKLNFYQDGDYLYIDLDSTSTDKIIIEYQGSSPIHYSTRQGVFLPGYFPYYPMPGLRKIYDINARAYLTNISNSDSKFKVNIESDSQIYSNLETKDNNIEGQSNGLTLVGGFASEEYLGNIKVINVFQENITIEEINSFYKELDNLRKILGKANSLKFNTVIRIPSAYTVPAGVYNVSNFNDHIMISSMDPKTMAVYSIIDSLHVSKDNKELKDIFTMYLLEDSDQFNSNIDSIQRELDSFIANNPESINNEYTQYLTKSSDLIKEFIKKEKEFGKNHVIKLIYNELNIEDIN